MLNPLRPPFLRRGIIIAVAAAAVTLLSSGSSIRTAACITTVVTPTLPNIPVTPATLSPAAEPGDWRSLSSVQSLSCVRLFATPWTTARQASLSITNSRSPPKPMSIELVMPSKHLILCRPLLLLLSIFPSIRVFWNESALHMRWPKYWSFSFNISPTNEHPGLISFRMDWLDLLPVQGTLKNRLQHHSSKASILIPGCCSHYLALFPSPAVGWASPQLPCHLNCVRGLLVPLMM